MYPLFIIGRIARRDTTLPTSQRLNRYALLFIPKRCRVKVNPHSLHWDPHVFDVDVEVFKRQPESVGTHKVWRGTAERV